MKTYLKAFVFAAIASHVLISEAQTSERYKKCEEALAQAGYTPHLASMLPAFSLDQERGISINQSWLRSAGIRDYPGESSHRLETMPDGNGGMRRIKEGLQISDLGGNPRRFEITEDYIENYAENFLMKPKPLRAKPIAVHIYRYKLEFKHGWCSPTSVSRISANGEEVLSNPYFAAERNVPAARSSRRAQ